MPLLLLITFVISWSLTHDISWYFLCYEHEIFFSASSQFFVCLTFVYFINEVSDQQRQQRTHSTMESHRWSLAFILHLLLFPIHSRLPNLAYAFQSIPLPRYHNFAAHCYQAHSFIHTEHLYSASSRELLRGAPDSSTAKKSYQGNRNHVTCYWPNTMNPTIRCLYLCRK